MADVRLGTATAVPPSMRVRAINASAAEFVRQRMNDRAGQPVVFDPVEGALRYATGERLTSDDQVACVDWISQDARGFATSLIDHSHKLGKIRGSEAFAWLLAILGFFAGVALGALLVMSLALAYVPRIVVLAPGIAGGALGRAAGGRLDEAITAARIARLARSRPVLPSSIGAPLAQESLDAQ